MSFTYEIRPVRAAEWLPDRCMSMMYPLAISHLTPQCGCSGLLSGKSPIRNRTDFEDFYLYVLNRFSCCGFVAWEKNRIIGYTNFFPHAIAREIKFYGWGGEDEVQPGTLVHHCISIIRNPDYRRKRIGIPWNGPGCMDGKGMRFIVFCPILIREHQVNRNRYCLSGGNPGLQLHGKRKPMKKPENVMVQLKDIHWHWIWDHFQDKCEIIKPDKYPDPSVRDSFD